MHLKEVVKMFDHKLAFVIGSSLALLLVTASSYHPSSLVSAQSSSSAGCHMRELDLCAASLLVLTQSRDGLATSDSEISKQCVSLKEADSCFKNYTRRCMTPMQRDIVAFSTNSTINSLLDEYCTKGSNLRSNYLKHAKCLNQLQKSGAQKVCMRELQVSLDLLTAPNGEHGKRLQLGCCTYNKFKNCVGDQLDKRCGKETVNFISSTLRRVTSRLPEVVCRHYKPEGNECKLLLPSKASLTRSQASKQTSVISRLFAAYSNL